MKFLFDILPVALFFAVFKGAESFPAESFSLASSIMGQGVTEATAPVFLATITAILATLCQVAALKVLRKPVEKMLWISLAVIVVFGGLTLYLRNELFIKWKPTILYWIFAAILLYGNATRRNFIRLLMKAQFEMPERAWRVVQNLWIGFFVLIGLVNLAVAYLMSTEAWVNFKLFGLLGLTFIFTIAVVLYMTKNASEGQN